MFLFFNATATTEIDTNELTLSLPDALPILAQNAHMPVGLVACALVILYARCFGVASRDAVEILRKPSQIAFFSSEIPVDFGDARARNLLHLIIDRKSVV